MPFLCFLLLAAMQPVMAEGTKQLEPTNPATTPNRMTRLMFDQTTSAHRTPFATINCAEKYRLNIFINNPLAEQICFGFNDGDETIYYQVKDPDGIIVSGFALAQVPASGQGFISTWDQANAGPNIGGSNPAGYNPKILTPTKSGNYYIEFARTQTGGTFSGQDMLLFDISVVQGTTAINGRLWSKAWQLSDAGSGDIIKSFPAKLFIYTDDGIVSKLNINEWNGGTYTVYCNQWGVKNTGNWAIDRMSTNTWPGSDLPQYKIFLNDPDVNFFPTGQLGTICEVTTKSYCNGTTDIMVRVNKPGSLTLNLDVAPVGPGPEDVVLNGDINGSANCDIWDTITWNGLSGTGTPVQNGTAVIIKISYLNGLTNLPLWDVEDNAAGLIVNIIRPIPSLFTTKLPVFWDDSNLAGGTVNSVNGCIYPSSVSVTGCHYWTNQNENMINTWWYFSDEYPNINVTVKRNPTANFIFSNNCSGANTIFTDQSAVPGGYAVAWYWAFGLMGDTSNVQNPTYIFTTPGNKLVHLRVTADNGCQGSINKTVLIQTAPVPFAGNDKLIQYGTSTSLQGSATGGSGTYSYHWEPANLLIDPDVSNPVTVDLFETTDFTLTVTDLGSGCQIPDVVKVTVTGGPLGANLYATPDSICKGATSQINLQASGGSGMYTYTWSSNPPGFTSNQEDIVVQPIVTTTYIVKVNDGFSEFTASITVVIHAKPIVNAGSSQSIPFGTSTLLSGSAGMGLPPYAYLWSPANLVVTPAQSSTSTTILAGSVNFTLSVTDMHGCSSSAQVQVSVTGGALTVNPKPEKTPICLGESTVLNPMSQGGSGSYTYTWTDAGGFLSHETNPEVAPTQTTTYHVLIDDGYTTSTGTTTVTVNPLPLINIIPAGAHIHGPDTMLACVFDTITLAVTLPNTSCLWSNGATNHQILSTTSGIAFDMLSYSVNVVNTLTGCTNTAPVTIIYTYSECTYGLPETNSTLQVLVYPNPGRGLYTCRLPDYSGKLLAEVYTMQGKLLQSFSINSSPGESQNFTFDISSEPSGIYLLKLSGTEYARVVKLIKY